MTNSPSRTTATQLLNQKRKTEIISKTQIATYCYLTYSSSFQKNLPQRFSLTYKTTTTFTTCPTCTSTNLYLIISLINMANLKYFPAHFEFGSF
ncbi:hypothetical protein PU02_1274 [Bartonella ancashensis]|uniref:Uncharacterized protein n=1 Tax=Bartonella ancashensis TaxID=1318743 RepID=A0A0M4L929_9HYPH|nr:hypothetical protein PU02_1274 [Bartonella ancashensis]